MEEEGVSIAALEAIKSLQKQLKQLEAENQEMRQERYRLQILCQQNSESRTEHIESISIATERANNIINQESETMMQISSLRHEIEIMKLKNREIESLLTSQRKKGIKLEKELESVKNDILYNNSKIADYEKYLAEFLRPPPAPTAMETSEALILSLDESCNDVLTDDYADLYSRLVGYPKAFHIQDLETKKKILSDLCIAHDATKKLTRQIKINENKRFSTSSGKMTKETKNLYQQYYSLANEIKRFVFKASFKEKPTK